MSVWVLPLVAALAFALYFALPLLRLPLYRRIPWELLAVTAAAAAFALYQLARAPGITTVVAAALSLGILGFAVWFFFSFSMYGAREDRPRVGDRFPDFTLPASDGSTFRLADACGRRLLILCYRGDW